MRQSRFNIVLKTRKDGSFVIYNSLSNSLVLVDQELLDVLPFPERMKTKNPRILTQLLNQGIIVEDNLDEKEIYKFNLFKQRFDTTRSEFMVTVTRNCNLVCPYCFEPSGDRRGMTAENLNKSVTFIESETIRNKSSELELQIFGGEPLTVPNTTFGLIERIERFAKSQRIRLDTIIYTNGAASSDRIMERLRAHQSHIKYVHVTLDGPKQIHDNSRQTRDGKGTYDSIMSFIKKLKDGRINSAIRINISQKNKDHIPLLLDDLVAQGVGDVPIYYGFIRGMTPSCSSMNGEEVNPNSCLAHLWEEALKRNINISVKPETTYNYCAAFKTSSFVIGVEAELYKCAGLQGIPQHCIGKIGADGEVKELKPCFFNFLSRDPSDKTPCADCKNLPVCGGGCASYSYTNHHTYHHPDCFNKSIQLTKEGLALFLKYQGPTEYRDLF